MKYIAEIKVMPLKHLPDHQGKTIGNCAQENGFRGIENIRVGKFFRIEIESTSKEEAMVSVTNLCNQFLCNTTVEGYEFQVEPK
jgi:phosphoribosylformylglycinamidine synthase PurS subunit